MQRSTYAMDSGLTYPVYTARRGSGGTPVPQSNAVPTSYEAHVGGKPFPQSNAVPPSYEAHVGGKPVPRSNAVPPRYGGDFGGIPVPLSIPVQPSYGVNNAEDPVPRSNLGPPSYEEFISCHDDSVQDAPTARAGAQADASENGAVKAEERRKKWAMFVAGNLISAAVVISDIAQLNVCFDEFTEDVSDDDIGSVERQEQIDEEASLTNDVMMFTLIFGLWVDVLSAFSLSLIYRSPLDIKSVHKIPSEDMRHCGGSVIVHFLSPFSWALIYLVGGGVSMDFSNMSSCDGQGGAGLEFYLLFSGVIMVLVALGMFFLSALILPFSCGSPTRRTDGCCARRTDGCCVAFRKKFHKLVLWNGPYLDTFWQLQGSVWSYRTGGFGLLAVFFVCSSSILGQVLAACGSLAPDIVQELAGPLA